MVSGKGKIAGEIDEALDIALITQQIEKKVFDGQQCINYITTKMLQLCAPVRDQSIRNISSLYPDLASMFQECLSILEAMKFDLMNYQLKSIRPTLKAQAVEYEQTKFEQAVKSGAVSLEITKSWLTEAATNLQAIATARNPENIQLPDNLVKFEDVYHEALQKLLFSSTPVSRASCPETFLLDAERLFKFQNELQVITVVSALVMLAKNAVTQIRRDRAVVQKLRDRLFILLNDDGSNGESRVTVANLTEEIISVCTLALERPNGGEEPKLSSEIQTLIRNMVERTLSTKDTLYSMISRRIQGCVRGQMSTGVFRSITGMSLASAGLDVVEKELMEVSRKIAMLAKHNKDVYSKWYDEILKNVL